MRLSVTDTFTIKVHYPNAIPDRETLCNGLTREPRGICDARQTLSLPCRRHRAQGRSDSRGYGHVTVDVTSRDEEMRDLP